MVDSSSIYPLLAIGGAFALILLIASVYRYSKQKSPQLKKYYFLACLKYGAFILGVCLLLLSRALPVLIIAIASFIAAIILYYWLLVYFTNVKEELAREKIRPEDAMTTEGRWKLMAKSGIWKSKAVRVAWISWIAVVVASLLILNVIDRAGHAIPPEVIAATIVVYLAGLAAAFMVTAYEGYRMWRTRKR